MKRALIIGAGVLAISGMAYLAAASFSGRWAAIAGEIVPADEILGIVSEMGLEPSTRVQQSGPYYIVHAVDPRGIEVRVVADARSGTILSVIPLRDPAAQARRYYYGPRIIEVPPADEADDSTVIYQRRDLTPPRRDGYGDSRAAPRRTTSAPPPPPARRRTLLNAPRGKDEASRKNDKDRALTPIYPTPRFDTEAESKEKFEQHGSDSADTPSPAAD